MVMLCGCFNGMVYFLFVIISLKWQYTFWYNYIYLNIGTDADNYFLIHDSSNWMQANVTCKATNNSSLVTMTERIYVELAYLLSNDESIENRA